MSSESRVTVLLLIPLAKLQNAEALEKEKKDRSSLLLKITMSKIRLFVNAREGQSHAYCGMKNGGVPYFKPSRKILPHIFVAGRAKMLEINPNVA